MDGWIDESVDGWMNDIMNPSLWAWDRDIGNGSGNEVGISGLGLILGSRVRMLG